MVFTRLSEVLAKLYHVLEKKSAGNDRKKAASNWQPFKNYVTVKFWL